MRKEDPFKPLPSVTSLPCRLINRLGKPFAPRISLNVEELMEKARNMTSLSDWGDTDFLEPLRVLTASYERDARLTPVGRLLTQKAQLHRLANRLRIQRDFNLWPEMLSSILPPTVFITGLPRTGTTLLHRLLAQDPEIRTLRTWELSNPSPPPDSSTYDQDPRRYLIRKSRAIRQRLFVSREGWEQINAVHAMRNDEPEECWFLLQNSFRSLIFGLFDRLTEYDSWLSKQDFGPVYQYYRKQLQLLTWRCPGTHLVLKAPEHLSHIDALFRVFPNARILLTHRNLPEVFPSFCHMTEVLRQMRSERADPREIGAAIAARVAALAKGVMIARKRYPADRFFDISFRNLVRDPMEVVGRIYPFIGKKLTKEAESRMKSWLSKNHPAPNRGLWKPFLQRYGPLKENHQTFFRDIAGYLEVFSEYLK